MIDRSTIVTACLVVVLVASLPGGAYAGASTQESSSDESPEVEDESTIDSLGCLPSPALRDISMNAYRQEATNLQTDDGTVTTSTNGQPDVEDTFGIESGYISASTMCFDGLSDDNDGIRLELNDVYFEDTELTGPWTDIEFEEGEANSMTVVLPPEEVLNLLTQIPGSIDLQNTIREAFGLDPITDDEARNESDDEPTVVDDADDETTDTIENTTDAVNDTVDNTTGEVDETVNDTTDTVDDTVNETTDAVDDTADNTTDVVDDTADNTTDAVDDTVDNTTDVVDDTADDTTDVVDDTVDNTTDAIDETTDGSTNETTGVVDDTVDETTDAVDDTVDNTTDAVGDTVDGTTDVISGVVSGTTGLIGG